MQTTTNKRGIREDFLPCEHAKLSELKQIAQHTRLYREYLYKDNIPEYPRPEFHLSHLKHDTQQGALIQICKEEGFKDPQRGSEDPLSLVWWSLAVGAEDIQSAEMRLLEKTYPDQTEEQAVNQESFLDKFATSPAFSEKSSLGSYRFTFPLQKVLTAYKEQFCSGASPIMRVFKTSLYKKEVVYIVLVHSPANEKLFSKYPKLPVDDPNAVCTYRGGCFIWRSEAMCKTHKYELIKRPEENLIATETLPRNSHEFYVWDHVAIALHVENGQVLKFNRDDLRHSLTFCEQAEGNVPPGTHFDGLESAKTLVKHLWPESDFLLEEEPPLMERFKAKEPKEDPMDFEDSKQ